jgi:hypothetical protein
MEVSMRDGRYYQAVLGVLFVAVVGTVGWMAWSDWNEGQIAARMQEYESQRLRVEALTHDVGRLEQALNIEWGHLPYDKAAEVYGVNLIEDWEATPKPDELERRVSAFFKYLDGRSYIRAYNLKAGVYNQYLAAMEALSLSPPKLGPTASLQEMKRNIAYFSRVLGKQRLHLVADVLQEESDLIEPTLHVFFQWYAGAGRSDFLKGRPSLDTAYAYASYLVETFGGQSYLMRRESRTRLLMTYYCILVLDHANDHKHNPYGVDIRPLIAAAARDMLTQKGLTYQKLYVADLDRLARKYRM